MMRGEHRGASRAIVVVVAGLVAAAACAKEQAAPAKARIGKGNERVVLRTTAGDLVVSFFPKAAPRTVEQFLRLARAGVLDGTHFTGIAAGFVAQTSSAHYRKAPLTDEQRKVITRLPLETSPLKHRRGILSMSRNPDDPDSGETSYCIMLGNAPHLDGKYTIFGKVESGLEVLAELEKAASGEVTKPRARVEITKVEVVDEQKAMDAVVLAASRSPLPTTTAAAAAATGEGAPSCHPAVQEGTVAAAHAPAAAAAPATGAQSAGGMGMAASGTAELQNKPIEISDGTNAQGEQVRTVLFKSLLIDKLYPSMHGPWNQRSFKLAPSSPYLWVTSYRAEVLDAGTGKGSQEFMCHTNLDLVARPGAPPEVPRSQAQLSIAQGQEELRFPKGFALKLENDDQRQLNLTAMVLNSNYPGLKKEFDFRSTIRYLDDGTARARKLTPLFQTSVYNVCPVETPKSGDTSTPLCESATPWEVHAGLPPYSGRQTGHWIVPPGRQVVTHDVTHQLALPYDTTLHYVWIHLHPYGEWMELKDKTTGKVVWKGRAKNHPTKAALLSTDHFSSRKGIPLFKDHRYELTTVYDNKGGKRVTAMAALWMYLKKREDTLARN